MKLQNINRGENMGQADSKIEKKNCIRAVLHNTFFRSIDTYIDQ